MQVIGRRRMKIGLHGVIGRHFPNRAIIGRAFPFDYQVQAAYHMAATTLLMTRVESRRRRYHIQQKYRQSRGPE